MSLLLAAALLAVPPAPQGRFRAELDGAQVVPPVITDSGGWASFHLNADFTMDYQAANWGMGGFEAALRRGAPGSEGGLVTTLSPGPYSWSGTTAVLSSADIAALQAGEIYLEIRTAAQPEGEVRGQLLAAPREFAAHLNGEQVSIMNPVPDTGAGRFIVNTNQTLTYFVDSPTYAGISAHIHLGPPGVNGAIIFPLQGGPHAWSGTTRPLSADEFQALQDGDYYVNVHGSITPGEEIRGQILRQGEEYGRSCGSGPALTIDGAPMPGAPLMLHVSGGPAGVRGVLVVSRHSAATLAHGCPVLVAGPHEELIPVRLDAAGAAAIPFIAPALPASRTLFLQLGGIGFASNGVQVDLVVF